MPLLESKPLPEDKRRRHPLREKTNARRENPITRNGVQSLPNCNHVIRVTINYTFDPKTGEITGTQLYRDLPKSGKIRGWIYSVHVGTWGGLTTRILSCLVSLLGAIFAVTGYYFWFRKQKGKKRR